MSQRSSSAKIIELAQALISESFPDSLAHFNIKAALGFLELVANGDIKGSARFVKYAKLIGQHADYLPFDGDFTVTEFITSMIYVNSLGREKHDQWSLTSMPTPTAKRLAKQIALLFKKEKVPYSWMD
jgi:hypothetical protein